MAQEIINVMNHDSGARDLWEFKLEQAGNPGDLTAVLKLARKMLRNRKVGRVAPPMTEPFHGKVLPF